MKKPQRKALGRFIVTDPKICRGVIVLDENVTRAGGGSKRRPGAQGGFKKLRQTT